MAVRVQYTYRHSYCDLRRYSDRGGQGSEWQYVYSTRTATVTVTYADTLTEGPCTVCVATLSHDLSYDVCVCKGDPCTWTVHVNPLGHSYYGCSNGTVTKHGSTGHG